MVDVYFPIHQSVHIFHLIQHLEYFYNAVLALQSLFSSVSHHFSASCTDSISSEGINKGFSYHFLTLSDESKSWWLMWLVGGGLDSAIFFLPQVCFSLSEELCAVGDVEEKDASLQVPRAYPITMNAVGGQTLAVFSQSDTGQSPAQLAPAFISESFLCWLLPPEMCVWWWGQRFRLK